MRISIEIDGQTAFASNQQSNAPTRPESETRDGGSPPVALLTALGAPQAGVAPALATGDRSAGPPSAELVAALRGVRESSAPAPLAANNGGQAPSQ